MRYVASIIGMLLGLIVGFLCFNRTEWIGGFTLSVSITSAGNRPITKVTCSVFLNSEAARGASDQEGLPSYYPSDTTTADPIRGGVLAVDVKSFGSDGLMANSYYQFRALLVTVEYKDGTQFTKVVDVPDGRYTTSISVSVP